MQSTECSKCLHYLKMGDKAKECAECMKDMNSKNPYYKNAISEWIGNKPNFERR